MAEVGWGDFWWKGVYFDALCLASGNFANFRNLVKSKATVDVHVYVNTSYSRHLWRVIVVYIQAWALALLVLLSWAMRRPPGAGRVTKDRPALFLYPNVIHGMARQERWIPFKILVDQNCRWSSVLSMTDILRHQHPCKPSHSEGVPLLWPSAKNTPKIWKFQNKSLSLPPNT